MAPNPTRATLAGRVFNDLRNKARREGRSTDELIVHYVLERFLYRVTRSQYRDNFVLKGGLLLAVMGARRATRDVDLLARNLDREVRNVLAIVTAIASIEVDDGVRFDVGNARSEPIRERELYEGTRILIPALIGQARANFALDVNFGDPVTPDAVRSRFPELLDQGSFSLLCYPVETVLAEKITTMLSLGDLSTRERDWADVWRLTGDHELDGRRVEHALARTAAYRGVEMRPLSGVIAQLPQLRQAPYLAWRRRQSVEAVGYPDIYAEVVRSVVEFADPPLTGQAAECRWAPGDRRWSDRPKE